MRAGNDDNDWTTAPPEDEGRRKWEVLRAPKKGYAELLILSPHQIGKRVHFWGNRTVPHTGETCRACAEGRRIYWEGYLACWDRLTKAYVLFAYTAPIGQQIATRRGELSSLKGQVLRVGRSGERGNSRIWIKWQEPIDDCSNLPIAPDLRPILERMWQAPPRSTEPKIEIQKPRLAPTGTEGDHFDAKQD